jgi:hypothetical protein
VVIKLFASTACLKVPAMRYTLTASLDSNGRGEGFVVQELAVTPRDDHNYVNHDYHDLHNTCPDRQVLLWLPVPKFLHQWDDPSPVSRPKWTVGDKSDL